MSNHTPHRHDITIEKIVKLFNDGKNYREIAVIFHTDSKIIISRLNDAGIKVERLTSDLRQDVDNDKLKELHDQGLSSVKISKIVGTSDVTVCNRLKRMGVIFPDRERKDINMDDVIRMYSIENKSAREIGDIYNVSHTFIYCKLKELGYVIKTKKEALEKHARINECVVCGNKFRPRKHWADTKSLNRKTCSDACNSALMSALQSGSNGSNWKGGASQVYYQRIVKELKPRICEICGDEVEERKDTHHMDGNHMNNTKENLYVWCVKCHAKYHYLTDDRGLRGWNPNTPKLKVFCDKLDQLGIEYKNT